MVGVSKAAIETLIRYLAVELAPHGIVCNAVSPGVVETEALDFFPSKGAILTEGLRPHARRPLRHPGRGRQAGRLAVHGRREDDRRADDCDGRRVRAGGVR